MMDAGWAHTAIGEIVSQKGLQTGPFGSQLKADEYTEDFGGVPVVMPQDILAGKIITDKIARTTTEKARHLSKHLLREGDILFPRRGDLSRIGLVSKSEDGWLCGTGCLRARIGKNGDPSFLSFYLTQKCILEWLEANAVGQTMLNLNTEIISNLPIYLPPLPEQRKIAEILGAWDRAIELTSALLAAARTRKRGLMQILLTGKCRFPEFEGQAWREVRLGDIANVSMGSSPKSSAYNTDGIGLALVQGNADIKNGKTAPRLSTSEITTICQIGDILLSVRAPVGTVAISNHKACIGRGAAVIRPKANTSWMWLKHLMISLESKWSRVSQGSTFDAINSKDIKCFSVLSPISVEEQERIGQTLQIVEEECRCLATSMENLRIQKRGLMQKLLTGEWRVKVEDPVV